MKAVLRDEALPHRSQINQRTSKKRSQKERIDLWVWLLSNRVNTMEIHGRCTKSLKESYQQKHPKLGLKKIREVQTLEGCQNPGNSTGRNQADKLPRDTENFTVFIN